MVESFYYRKLISWMKTLLSPTGDEDILLAAYQNVLSQRIYNTNVKQW